MVSALPPAPPAIVTAAPSPVSIRDLVEMTTISSLSVSPDGRWVAFRADRPSIDRNRVELSWYVVPLDGSEPARRICDGGQGLFTYPGAVVLEAPLWSPRSNAIYYRALINGEIQVWRAPIDASGATRLTANPANVRSVALDADGASLTYTVDATRAALDQAEQDSFDQGTPGDGSADLGRPASRGWFVDGGFASQRFTRGWYEIGNLLWHTPVRTVSIALPAADRGDSKDRVPQLETVARDNRYEKTSAHWRLAVKPEDASPIICTAALCDSRGPVAALRVRDRSGYLVTLREHGQTDLLAWWNPVDQSTRTIVTSDGILTGGDPAMPGCVGTADSVACVAESATTPPRLVRIATATGEIRTLFDPNAALGHRITTPAKSLTWRDHRGVAHSAELVLPATPQPEGGYPLVLTYYWCDGFLRGGTGGELPILPLAEHGVAALCINRSSTGASQDARRDQRQAIEDIRTVLGKLTQEGSIDRRHVGMWGFSFGSEVESQVLIHTDLLAAAAVASNLIDPPLYWYQSLPGRDYASNLMRKIWHLGPPDQDAAAWRKVAPAMNVDKIHAPLLLQMPENEARASIELWSKLSASTIPAEFWMFADERHVKIFPRHQAVAMARNMDWFRYWLLGAEDPDPTKRDQYARWDALRQRWTRSTRIRDRPGP